MKLLIMQFIILFLLRSFKYSSQYPISNTFVDYTTEILSTVSVLITNHLDKKISVKEFDSHDMAQAVSHWHFTAVTELSSVPGYSMQNLWQKKMALG
jgi:hypothetical protein